MCTDTLFSRELTWVFEQQLWNLCLGLCVCVEELYLNCTSMKLGKSVWHISSSQNVSQSVRFLIYFQKLSTELTLLPRKTEISAIHKGNQRFCVCMCSASSLEQRANSWALQPKTFNKYNSLPLFLPSFSPSLLSLPFPHFAETCEIRTAKTFQVSSNFLWIITH